MTTSSRVLQLARIFFAVLTLGAIGLQLRIHVDAGFSVVNFFSFFTNLSNIQASITLLFVAGFAFSGRQPSRTLDFFRGAAVVQMLLVGAVFNTLLLNVDLGGLLPWINNVVHRVMPVVMILDWWWASPGRSLSRSWIFAWLIFPAAYLAYSTIRGAMVSWYPYPFFDPEKVGGAQGVALYCLAMLVGLLIISFVTYRIGKRTPAN